MTYSIAAVDPASGTAGVATLTGGLAVGAFVPHALAGVGAIATQGASTNWLYGERGLWHLGAGAGAQEVLRLLTDADDGRDYRQCIIVDRRGEAVVWTGDQCESACSHVVRPGVAAAGNTLAADTVADSMVQAFETSSERDFAERLLLALQAGKSTGGDWRGMVSAALVVDFLDHPPVNVRVDYAPDKALDELAALYERYRSSPFREFYDSVPTRSDFSRYEERDVR